MDELFEDDQREPDADLLRWFKDKLHKLDGYEDYMFLDKEHMPAFADFIFSFVAKKLYCYMDTKDGQPCFNATYSITSIRKQISQILYIVRDAGFMNIDSVQLMVSLGTINNSTGARLARCMSDVQMMVKRRETNPQIQRIRETPPKVQPEPPKKNALMASLSDSRLPSRVGSRTPAPVLFADTMRGNLDSTKPAIPQSNNGFDGFNHPLLKIQASTKAGKSFGRSRN